MKNLKKIMFIALFGAMSLGAFYTYEHLTMSDAERALLENVEALTYGEDGGTVRKNCGLIWGKGCYADNYGATCQFHSDCSN